MKKQATTIDEQIELLRKRGMIIKDSEKAKEVLLDIGYFRLGFYCFPFECSYPQKRNRTHEYKPQTLLSDVVKLYYFDYNLRSVLAKYINRIEINFRTFLTYQVSNKHSYDPVWFVSSVVVTGSYANKFNNKVYDDKFKLNPIIKRHHIFHPNDVYAPAWKTIEFMTFGAVYNLYRALVDVSLKREIAMHFGIKSVKTFENYMETIRVIRNTCAHGGVLFDISLAKAIKDGPAGVLNEKSRQNLDGAIKVIRYMVDKVSMNRANDMNDEICKLFDENTNSCIVTSDILKKITCISCKK
jgi:abortive infection bacteriophage resistance protein